MADSLTNTLSWNAKRMLERIKRDVLALNMMLKDENYSKRYVLTENEAL